MIIASQDKISLVVTEDWWLICHSFLSLGPLLRLHIDDFFRSLDLLPLFSQQISATHLKTKG
jgi:hypothetical protein